MTSGIGGTTWRSLAGLAAAAALSVGLCGCGLIAPPEPDPTPTASPTQPATPEPEPTPQGPVLVPDGTAEDNLPLFTQVVAEVWATDARVQGAAYIDALTAAGFDRAAMQVTKDVTTLGRPAESIQFAVAWGEADCLVGQVGPSTGAPVTEILPQLGEVGCLLGELRPIDW